MSPLITTITNIYPNAYLCLKHGFTVLQHAARSGNVELCTYLISLGADITAKDEVRVFVIGVVIECSEQLFYYIIFYKLVSDCC